MLNKKQKKRGLQSLYSSFKRLILIINVTCRRQFIILSRHQNYKNKKNIYLHNILISKKYVQKYNLQIDLYIIESWWGGNNEFYDYLSSYIKIHNVMCMGSILYYYNLFFQNYFKVNKYIQFPLKKLFYKYIQLPFPFGFTEYFGDHHYISRFLRFY